MTPIKVIEKLKDATEDLAKAFIIKYFPEQVYGEDTYWVGDDVGTVFFVSDFFFGVDRMVEALELDATFEQINDYYNAVLDWGLDENQEKPFPVNFNNYVKYEMELPVISGEKL